MKHFPGGLGVAMRSKLPQVNLDLTAEMRAARLGIPSAHITEGVVTSGPDVEHEI